MVVSKNSVRFYDVGWEIKEKKKRGMEGLHWPKGALLKVKYISLSENLSETR